MCGLCGVLGVDHWTDAASSPAAFGGGVAPTRRQERQLRVRLANAALDPLGLSLADFQGQSYVLSNRTGRSEIIDDMTALWPVVESMLGRKADPLDPAYLERLERREGGP